MSEVHIKINEPQKDLTAEIHLDLSLDEMKSPLLEVGQTGKIILPVKVVSRDTDKVRFVKNGPAEMQGSFRQQKAAEMRENLAVAERDE